MEYLNDQILKSLKRARKDKGLSQRELSTKSGVPQSHISKIESGSVDLRVSSLITLARILDFELELVPRKTVPAVQAIVRRSINVDLANVQRHMRKEMGASKTIRNTSVHSGLEQFTKALPAYSLDDEVDDA